MWCCAALQDQRCLSTCLDMLKIKAMACMLCLAGTLGMVLRFAHLKPPGFYAPSTDAYQNTLFPSHFLVFCISFFMCSVIQIILQLIRSPVVLIHPPSSPAAALPTCLSTYIQANAAISTSFSSSSYISRPSPSSITGNYTIQLVIHLSPSCTLPSFWSLSSLCISARLPIHRSSSFPLIP